MERAVALCREYGFVPHVDFLLGMPGEVPSDVEATLRLMDRLVERGAKVHGHTFLPLPGTPWRKAPPGVISAEARRILLGLVARGHMYGQWEGQELTARELASQRAAGGLAPPRN